MEYSYKFRIYPTIQQIKQIHINFGCSRFIYNYYLSKRKKIWDESKKQFGYCACCKDLTLLKKELIWLNDADAHCLLTALKDLELSYHFYFDALKKHREVGFPKFRSRKSNRKSYRSPNVDNGKGFKTIKLDNNKIKLPKLGYVNCKISKQIRGRILSATISQNPSGKYFVSLCCTDVELDKLPNTGKSVGIDLGIKDLAVTSDEEKYSNNKYLKQSEKKLARLQRQLSRKPSDSKNHKKARIKVARAYERVSNQRRDMMQKLTTDLIRKYDVICIEDLNICGMRKNHNLSDVLNDASFSEFRRELEYKAQWYGKRIVKIDRFFPSSQTCSTCGAQWKALKDLKQRSWICPSCMTHHDRDINASINILKEGLKSVS